MDELRENMAKFPGDWQEGCPPADAVDADGEFFRVVKQNPCVADDFKTHAEMGSQRKACPCLRVGLSVLADIEHARHYRDKYPSLGNMIASGKLSSDHGRIKAGKNGHVTWWSYSGVLRHSLFSIVTDLP